VIKCPYLSNLIPNAPDSTWKHTIIDFNTSPPQITEQLGNISFAITNLVMSDEVGELLFYSEGEVIQNKYGETLENGGNISPDTSVTQKLREQTMLSVPYPNDEDKYFILHSESTWVLDNEGNTLDGYFAGIFNLYYSIVLFDENGEEGQVLEKNISILNDTLDFGKLTACKHANGRDWWFLVPKYWSNTFYRYLLTPEGLNTLAPQTIGDAQLPALGMAQFTPDGTMYIASGSRGGEVNQTDLDIFDFDRCTGLLSNQRRNLRQNIQLQQYLQFLSYLNSDQTEKYI